MLDTRVLNLRQGHQTSINKALSAHSEEEKQALSGGNDSGSPNELKRSLTPHKYMINHRNSIILEDQNEGLSSGRDSSNHTDSLLGGDSMESVSSDGGEYIDLPIIVDSGGKMG